MNKNDLKRLIKESLHEILSEKYNYDALIDDVSSRTMIGSAWNKMIYQLSNLMDEVEGFNASFGGAEKIATDSYLAELKQILSILERLHAPVRTMSQIQEKDGLSEEHPHGRYAQQAGATPFEPPQDF